MFAAVVLLSHALLVALGALTAAFGRIDAWGVEEATRRFEPALAPGLLAALGPRAPIFLALGAFVLSAALLGDWRRAPRTFLATIMAVLLATELWGVGTLLFERPGPLALDPGLPVPEDWRAAWQPGGSYPSRHALMVGALAGSALLAWVWLGLPALVLAVCGAAAAVYFGAAHVSDVMAGLALGCLAAVCGRLGAGLVWSGRLR
ncbi:MAG TPA: phosphatase PAP2 family protein [Chloroflexota bacterium]|nr:phosphatase PAP2 family protein [Chloroflexota bacterium]